MKATASRSTLALAVAMAAATQTAPTYAQSSEAVLEEVTVTARRRSENLQDVPIAVTALSGDALSMRGAADISEIAQIVPSVTIEPSRATSSTLTAFIRGVGQQDPLAGFEQGVALYLDDVYIARPQGAMLDIYDVERVEVLRGPQGTLYGRNAVGGAIKYVTRRLGDETEVRLKGAVGSYNQVDLIGTVSTPLADNLRVGATIASLKRAGYGENLTTGDDHYNKDLFAYRLSAEWEPNEDLLVRLAYDNSNDETNPVSGHRPFVGAVSGAPVLDDIYDTRAGASELPTTAGINGNNGIQAEGFSISVDWSISEELTLRYITARREDYTESVIDFDSLAVPDLDAPVIYDNDQSSQEFQLLYNTDRWNVVAGLYYLDATAKNDFDVVLGQLGPLTAYTGGSVDTESWSVFTDVTYNISETLSLSVGGRYTEDERSADIFRGTYAGTGSPFLGNDSAVFLVSTSDFSAENTYTNFSPRINLSYRLSEDMTAYASYSQGWKAGSFDPRGANFVTPEVEDGFDDESLDSYEAGLKTTWMDGRATTNVAVFFSDYQDMQIPGSLPIDTDNDGFNDDFVGTVTNAGEAEITGIEIEGTMLLTDNLSAQIAVSKLDAEIKEWMLNGVNVASERAVQNTPEEMAYIGFTYNTDLANGLLTLNANWSYKGDITQFEAPTPAIDQESYDMINASAVWLSGDEKWLVGLHGKNLGDEEIKTAGYCFGTGCAAALGLEDNTTVFYAPPRTITATVEYRM